MTKSNQPLLPGVGILALVYHEWGFPWMTPHHVLTRLARYFQIVWINPAHGWREIPSRLLIHRSKLDQAELPPGFTIYNPEPWLPKLYRPQPLALYTFCERLRRARSLLVSRGCQKIVLYLWHPQFKDALTCVPFDASCYHIDDEYSFSSKECQTDKIEERLIASVDEVFVISPALLEKKGKINPHTIFAPEGVEYDAYATAVAEPADIAPIPHPRIGYTGVLKKQLDWPLLRYLANNHPAWSFVFVGPQAPHQEIKGVIQELSSLHNVHFLGAKSTQQLAAYPQHFDVCIMPYRIDDYTKFIYPLKLHEYLASGRPIVGAPIRSLHEFDHVITLVGTEQEWSHALRESLAPTACSSAAVEARQNIARRYDWGRLVRLIARTMCDRLGSGYPARFDDLPIKG